MASRVTRKSDAQSVGGWLAGAVVLVAPYLLLEFVAPGDVSRWSRVYIAGAFGGICFELIRNRWRLEMPSDNRGLGKSPEPTFAPFGPLWDIGFFGRMITGAIAAPTFIAVVDTLDASEAQAQDLGAYLTTIAERPDTLAWAVAVGFAAPAVWTMLEAMVKARGAVADTRLEIVQARVNLAKEKLNKQVAEVATLRQQATGANGAEPVGNGANAQALASVEGNLSELLGVLDTAPATVGPKEPDET